MTICRCDASARRLALSDMRLHLCMARSEWIDVRTYIPMIFFRGDLRENENVDFVSVNALYLFGTITCLGIANAIWRFSS